MKADSYAYRDRRNRKRDFRRLWITRINAAARQNGMTYGTFIHGLQAGRHRAGPQGPGRHRRARPRDLPPIRRRRPRGVGGAGAAAPTPTSLPGAAPTRTAPFLFPNPMITPAPQRQAQGGPPARRPAQRATSGALRRRGRGPASRPPTPRAGRRSHAACGRQRLDGERSSRRCWPRSRSSARARAALGVYEQRWARAGRAAVRRAVGRRRPGQRRTVLRAARPSARLGRARARAAPTRSARRRCGRRWARSSRCRSRACASVGELPGRDGRARRRASGEPLRGPRAPASVTLVVGAEREGLPAEVVAGVRPRRPHPDRGRVAERRDGGDVALYEADVGWRAPDRTATGSHAAARPRPRRDRRRAPTTRRARGAARALPRPQGRAAEPAARRRRAAARGARRRSARPPTRRARRSRR